jgi:hypothetical protein
MRSLLLIFGLISVTALGAEPSIPVLLPEVITHMKDGRACLANGDRALAAAHARVILVSNQIKIRISTAGYSPAVAAKCQRALVEACETWQAALGDSFEFILVDAQTQADVYTIFQPDVRLRGRAVAGYVRWQRTVQADDGKPMSQAFRANMQLRTSTPEGRPMPAAAMRHEACHELGHVLGLDDSRAVGTAMGPLDIEHPANGPTAAEVDAVRKLREDANNLLAEAQRPNPAPPQPAPLPPVSGKVEK